MRKLIISVSLLQLHFEKFRLMSKIKCCFFDMQTFSMSMKQIYKNMILTKFINLCVKCACFVFRCNYKVIHESTNLTFSAMAAVKTQNHQFFNQKIMKYQVKHFVHYVYHHQ